MWVFGYGSLMWDGWEKEFSGHRVDSAVLPGFRRAFNKASTMNWGTPGRPGPTLGLEPESNASVIGVAFKFADEKQAAVLAELKSREGASFALESREILISERGKPVAAVVPLNNRHVRTYIGNVSIGERAMMADTARGKSGRCADYAHNVQRQLRDLGISDPHVDEFVAQLEQLMRGREEG
jgi:cation transport protein ChaC